jgi:predicted thioesterase
MDDVLGSLNWLILVPAVTGRLEVDFRMPVPVGSTLVIDAEIVGQERRKIYTRGTARLGSESGPIACEATGLFIQVPLEHFGEHVVANGLEITP